jgi:hypothetical protein
MKIGNLISSLSDASSLTKRNGTAAAASSGQAAATASQDGISNSAAARNIIAQYDLTSISPNEFSQMIQKLTDAGAISQKDQQDLSGVRTDLAAAGIQPDETTNLMDFYTKKIQETQEQTAGEEPATQQQQLSPLLQRLDWVEKINAMKTQPENAGISALA